MIATDDAMHCNVRASDVCAPVVPTVPTDRPSESRSQLHRSKEMRIASRPLFFIAAIALLAGCGSDTPTSPASSAVPTGPAAQPSAPSTISNDLVTSAGNSIATDLELLGANETAAGIGPVAFNVQPAFDRSTS